MNYKLGTYLMFFFAIVPVMVSLERLVYTFLEGSGMVEVCTVAKFNGNTDPIELTLNASGVTAIGEKPTYVQRGLHLMNGGYRVEGFRCKTCYGNDQGRPSPYTAGAHYMCRGGLHFPSQSSRVPGYNNYA